MNPFSEYDRIPAGDDALEKRMKRLSNNFLVEGSVRCLNVTEKQFASLKLFVGLPLFQEKGWSMTNAAVLSSGFLRQTPVRPK